MIERLFALALAATLAWGNVQHVGAAGAETDLQERIDGNTIGISVNRATLYVTGAEGQTLEVVSVTGKRVATVKIENPAQRVELDIPKGCYILKIGQVVRKVSIR